MTNIPEDVIKHMETIKLLEDEDGTVVSESVWNEMWEFLDEIYNIYPDIIIDFCRCEKGSIFVVIVKDDKEIVGDIKELNMEDIKEMLKI